MWLLLLRLLQLPLLHQLLVLQLLLLLLLRLLLLLLLLLMQQLLSIRRQLQLWLLWKRETTIAALLRAIRQGMHGRRLSSDIRNERVELKSPRQSSIHIVVAPVGTRAASKSRSCTAQGYEVSDIHNLQLLLQGE